MFCHPIAASAGGELIDFLGALLSPTVRLGHGEEDAVLIRQVAPPRHEIGLHSHVDPGSFYVIHGELEVFVTDAVPGWRKIGMGESCLVANGVGHALRNPHNEQVDFIAATNNRLLSFFRRGGRIVHPTASFTSPTQTDVAKVGRLARDYGCWRASPDESLKITGIA